MSAFRHQKLIQKYVDVCNKALHENSDRFPFKQILGAASKAEQGASVEVKVSDRGGDEAYVFYLEQGGIICKPHDDCKECKCVRTWNASLSYLEDVTSRPEVFITNPAKINWEWMYEARR